MYWIYNIIRAVFFSKFERLFKKNMYNSIIQSIAQLKLRLFPIFLAICGFHPKRTAPAAGLAAKNESNQFLIPCSDVNRIPVRVFCIDRNRNLFIIYVYITSLYATFQFFTLNFFSVFLYRRLLK